MTEWLDPSGRTTYGIGLCDRCHQKFPLDELYRDPNAPGLRVCLEDLDVYDPYRLPARQTENIALPFTRPDESLDTSLLPPPSENLPGVSLAVTSTTSTSVSLGWTPPGEAIVVSYRVYRSVDGGAYSLLATDIPATTTTYTDNTVDRTAHFYDYYVVYADFFGGLSNPSNIVHVGLALTVASMVTLRNIWHASGGGTMTYTTPGGCDVQIAPTNFNQSSVPVVPVYPKPTSGKYYFEARQSSISGRPNSGANAAGGFSGQVQYTVGSGDTGTPSANQVVFYDTYEGGTNGGIWDGAAMNNIVNGSFIVGDVLNMAIDYSVNKMWFGKNGVWKGPGTQDPATGQGGFTPPVTNTPPMTGATPHNYWGPWLTGDFSTTPETLQWRFSRAFWTFTPPSGFNNEYIPWTLGPASLSAPPFVDPNPGSFDFQNFIPGLAICVMPTTAPVSIGQFRGGQQRGAGKRYFEGTIVANFSSVGSSGSANIGIVRASASSIQNVEDAGVGIGSSGIVAQNTVNHGVYGGTSWYGQTVVAGGIDGRGAFINSGIGGGDTVMVAVDFTAQRAWFGVNGVWLDFQDPTTGAGGIPLGSVNTDWVVAISCNKSTGTSNRWQLNTGGLAFLYKPSGFLGWDE